MGSLLLNGHETALLFSSQNGINILEARSEPGVESVFFLSEIGSGFLEPDDTPPPRIRRSTPGAYCALPHFKCGYYIGMP